MGATVGPEVVTNHGASKPRRLDADAVPNQAHHVEVARLTQVYRRGPARCRRGQLDVIIHAEVLELDQLTFRHPVSHGHTSGGEEQHVNIQPCSLNGVMVQTDQYTHSLKTINMMLS